MHGSISGRKTKYVSEFKIKISTVTTYLTAYLLDEVEVIEIVVALLVCKVPDVTSGFPDNTIRHKRFF
jgi:hypothetical protein